MRILVLNAGSSSLKFQLIDTDGAAIAESRDRRLARGVVERIGGQAIVTLQVADDRPTKSTAPIRDHAAAVEHVIAWLTSAESGVEIDSIGQIEAVGHRVVHGGERFTHSTRIDDTVALWTALWAGVLVLAVLGWIAFARRGASWPIRLAGALGTAAFGFAMILLKAFIH